MRKKSKTGWIEDCSPYNRDYHSSEIKKKRQLDETLKYFSFGYEGDPTTGRLLLHIPKIAKRKKFWDGRDVLRVKVTIELVKVVKNGKK